MVETIFDITELLGDKSIWFWYIIFVVLIGIWAKSKNRNPWNWVILALFISPLLAGIFLLFSGKLEKSEEGSIYCSNCGEKVVGHFRYCPKCGRSINEDKEKSKRKECSPYSPLHFAKEVLPHKTLRRKRNNEIEEKEDMVVLFILMGIVSIGLGIWFWFYNKINLIPLILSVFVITPAFDKVFNTIFKKSKYKWIWWKKALLVSAIIISFVIINLLIPECPKSCDDSNRCTNDFCSKETGYKCMNVLKLNCDGNGICEAGEYGKSADCPDCDDDNKCTADSYDAASKQCIHVGMKGCIP